MVACIAQLFPGTTISTGLRCVALQVLCSVPDMAAALGEIRRVLKPNGKLLLIEHVRSDDDQFLRLQQYVLDPLQQVLADGCHLTRDTQGALVAAGFDTSPLDRFQVQGMSLIAPHVGGLITV